MPFKQKTLKLLGAFLLNATDKVLNEFLIARLCCFLHILNVEFHRLYEFFNVAAVKKEIIGIKFEWKTMEMEYKSFSIANIIKIDWYVHNDGDFVSGVAALLPGINVSLEFWFSFCPLIGHTVGFRCLTKNFNNAFELVGQRLGIGFNEWRSL